MMHNYTSKNKSTIVANVMSVCALLIFVSSCSHKKTQRTHRTNEGRYAIQQDRAPKSSDFDTSTMEQWDIVPETKSRYGNHSPYVVFGKTYYLADTSKNFEQTGTASWYGKKFHGHKTSNMETFDMYKLTAAHRTLPLPSYVEVTNLDNNKKVVVRVNDRGPFKSKRIIDLSWAAAKALGYDKKGLANVHIRLIQAPGKTPTTAQSPQQPQQPEQQLVEYKTDHSINGLKFLQIGAFSQKKKALTIAKQISQMVLLPVHVSNTIAGNPLYRVRVGPLSENENIIDIIQQVHKKGFTHTKMVVE